MDVKGTPGGAGGILAFDEWAKTHLPADQYKEMKDLDDRYMKTAKAAELVEPYSIEESRKKLQEFKKGLEPLRKRT